MNLLVALGSRHAGFERSIGNKRTMECLGIPAKVKCGEQVIATLAYSREERVVFSILMGGQEEGWEKIARGMIDMLVIGEEITWENRKKFYEALEMSNERGNNEVRSLEDEEYFPRRGRHA